MGLDTTRNSTKKFSPKQSRASLLHLQSTIPLGIISMMENTTEDNTVQDMERITERNRQDSPLLGLPRGLRDKIYREAFYTESGYVLPYTFERRYGNSNFEWLPYTVDRCNSYRVEAESPKPGGRICRNPFPATSLMRTCKQICSEGKDAFWRQNGLLIRSRRGCSGYGFKDVWECRLREKCLLQVRRVLLDFKDNFDVCGCKKEEEESYRKIFKTLKRMADKGNLKSVALYWVPCNTNVFSVGNLGAQSRSAFKRMMRIFEEAGKPDGPLSGLEKKIVFKDAGLSPLAWSVKGKKLALREREMGEREMKRMNDAFGGEVWLNGELVFRDGVQKMRTGRLPREKRGRFPTTTKRIWT